MKLCVLVVLLVLLALATAFSPDLDSSIVSEDDFEVRSGKFLVYTRTISTVTVFTSTFTQFFSVFTSCWKTTGAAPITPCAVTSLGTAFAGTPTGRKKRSLLEQTPVILKDGEIVPFKLSSQDELIDQEDEPQKEPKVEATKALERHPRLVTVIQTATVSTNLTITVTTTPLNVQSLIFTSMAAGHCLPQNVVATIPSCIT